ncbi:MAG: DEAD/DEAH box helicase [Marinilabiliales bacterium]|nr:DEAD/DEAH box helicase [Marinilabiliales bacterium]
MSESIQVALRNLGYAALLPMQLEMMSRYKTSRQLLLYSPTGSGKTVAYLLPVMETAMQTGNKISALVVVPTHELALQIESVFRTMGTGLKVTTCYGGHPVKTEINNLSESPTLLIGTPGRLLYHLRKGHLVLSSLDLFILDEYDKSLELGFEKEISGIVADLPEKVKWVLTSASKASVLPQFIRLENPVILDYPDTEIPNAREIRLVRANGTDKLELLVQLLGTLGSSQVLIFCNHRDAVERISDLLQERSIVHDTYHGGHEQSQRERSLIKFRNGSCPVLVTTDLASRGLDISGIEHVVHYQTAGSETIFLHRNGRTARMLREGLVWVLATSDERLPDFVTSTAVETSLPTDQNAVPLPYYDTLYLSLGRKDKISKTDIVGFLIQKGALTKEDIGLVHLLDYESFAAVPRSKLTPLLSRLKGEKIKNKVVQIRRAR